MAILPAMAKAKNQTAAEYLDAILRWTNSGFVAQDFTPKEQECISAKISLLRKEGKDQEQAVAMAVSECAPEKSKSSAVSEEDFDAMFADKEEENVKPDLPGGEYASQQNPDGTWNIFNVSIFCSHSRDFGGETVEIGKDWLISAMRKAVKRFMQDNYMPPLHIRHHGFGEEVKRAGFFKLRSVKKSKYEGSNLWVTYADLINVPDDVYQMIRSGELPYRSVEILDVDNPEIDSLALLDHEVPYFRLDLLTIGEEARAKSLKNCVISQAERLSDARPILAYRALGERGAQVLVKFGGEQKMDDLTKTPDVIAQDEDEPKASDEAEGKKAEEASATNFNVEAVSEAIESIETGLGVLKSLISEEGGEEEAEGDDPPAPVEMNADGEEVTVKAEGYKAKAKDVEIAKLAARVDNLESDVSSSGKVAEAQAFLKSVGRGSDKSLKYVAGLAKRGGVEALEAYMQGVKDHVSVDPPEDWDTETTGPAVDQDMVPFAKLGTKVLGEANKFGAEYDKMKERMDLSFSRSSYIAGCLKDNGYKAKELESLIEDKKVDKV